MLCLSGVVARSSLFDACGSQWPKMRAIIAIGVAKKTAGSDIIFAMLQRLGARRPDVGLSLTGEVNLEQFRNDGCC
jgi:hypothetical protein